MTPGKVVGFSLRGERTYQISGLRNESEPMLQTTSFDIGSVTKIISTTAILMRMVEQKEIDLNQKVSTILENWSHGDKSAITIADLLEHQSGLNEWKPFYAEFQSKMDAYKDIATQPLKYVRRSGRHYSDLNFITLGEIIEKVRSRDLQSIFTEEISSPLGLKGTAYGSPVDSENVAATSLGDRIEKEMIESQNPYPVSVLSTDFKRWRNHRLNGEVNDGNAFHLFHGVSGHAGLFSTVDDLLTFGEELLARDSLFSSDVVGLFISPKRDSMQGYGFRNWKLGKYVGHTGFPGVALAIDFESAKVIAMMTNRLIVDGPLTPTDELLFEFL